MRCGSSLLMTASSLNGAPGRTRTDETREAAPPSVPPFGCIWPLCYGSKKKRTGTASVRNRSVRRTPDERSLYYIEGKEEFIPKKIGFLNLKTSYFIKKNKKYDSPLEVIARFVSQTGNFGDGCHDHSKNNQYGENYTNQMDGVFQVDRSGWFCHFSIDDFTATGTIRRIAGNLFSTGRTLDQSSHLLDSFPVLQIYFLRLLP